ncbi:MAG: DsbA family protein [Chloroflexota bacterium]
MVSRSRRFLATSAVMLGVALGVVLIALSLGSASADRSTASSWLSKYLGDTKVEVGRRSVGDPNAPVKILVYFDFQCGHCQHLHEQIEGELIKRYVATGTAYLEARPVPFLGQASLQAAEGVMAAADQGAFWDYRDALFTTWASNGPSTYSSAGLRSIAGNIGLDVNAFGQSLDAQSSLAELKQIYQEAQDSGVEAVPTIVINGKAIVGVQPIETYDQAIDEALHK